MKAFSIFLYLCSKYQDAYSRWILFGEWLHDDPCLEKRFRVETLIEAIS
jgi:hypothetical protein